MRVTKSITCNWAESRQQIPLEFRSSSGVARSPANCNTKMESCSDISPTGTFDLQSYCGWPNKTGWCDHFKISSENTATLEQPNNLQTSDLINDNHDSVSNPFLFTTLYDTDVESTCNTPQSSVEPSQWPHRNCGPPKRLIEEMD